MLPQKERTMKLIKMLGLAVVAAVAMTALLGTAAAMAGEEVQLCEEAEKVPCPEENTYSTGETISSILDSGTEAELSGIAEVKCQKSTVEGKTTGNEETAGGVGQLIGEITSATWTKCHTFGGLISCTAEALQLPWKVHVVQATFAGRPEQSDGWMYVGPKTEQPGAHVSCFGISATCKVQQEQPEHSGEWGKLKALGGEPGHIKAENLPLKSEGKENQCTWNASYTVVTPSPMYVTHKVT
jgi:hypothetical protein